MIIKGIVESTAGVSGEAYTAADNKLLVRLPTFETAGSSQEVLTYATVCKQPGSDIFYKPGDVVFVGFESNNLDKAIILGKLQLNAAMSGDGGLEDRLVAANLSLESTYDGTMLRDYIVNEVTKGIEYVEQESGSGVVFQVNQETLEISYADNA